MAKARTGGHRPGGKGAPASRRAGAPDPRRPNPGADARRWEAGLAAFGRRDWDGALAAWKNCGLPQAGPARAEALFRRALASGNHRAAADDLRAAMALSPADPRLPYHLGLALVRAGDAAAALGPLRQAARLDPGQARLQETLDLVSALQGAPRDGDARGRLLAASVAAARQGPLPTAWAGAPGWAAHLLDALGALAGGDWERATRQARAVLAADAALPGAVLQLAAHWEAWSAALGAGEVRVVEAAGLPWEARAGRVRRWALACRLEGALDAGDVASATEAWGELEKAVSPPREVRDLVTLRLGAARARQGDWAGALDCFRQVQQRFPVAQAVAVSAERAGMPKVALEAWGQVADAAQRGELPPGCSDRQAVLAVARRHQVRLLDAGAVQDDARALRTRQAAIDAEGDRASVQEIVSLASAHLDAADDPGHHWDQARALAARALRLAPDDPDVLLLRSRVEELYGDVPAALAGVRRLSELLAGRAGPLEALTELTGRAIVQALLAGRPGEVAEYCASLAAATAPLGVEHWLARHVATLVEMGTALARRAQGGALRGKKAAWDRVLKGNPPPSALVLRGVIELLGRKPENAQAWFQRRVDLLDALDERPVIAGYRLAEIGYAHCWVRQLRGGPLALASEDCAGADLCQSMWRWLDQAAMYHPGVLAGPPPAGLAGCTSLPAAHAQWAQRRGREVRRVRRRLDHLKRIADDLGLSAEEFLDQLKGDFDDV